MALPSPVHVCADVAENHARPYPPVASTVFCARRVSENHGSRRQSSGSRMGLRGKEGGRGRPWRGSGEGCRPPCTWRRHRCSRLARS
eukprot:3403714-Rhodomonas_salina.2